MSISSKSLVCCICGANTPAKVFKKIDGFELLKCQECRLIRLSHVAIPAEDFLADAADDKEGKVEYWGYPEYFKKHADVFNHFFNERFQKIKRNLVIEGPWLDVGSGYGLWQKFLVSKNQKNFGIEIEKKAFLSSQSEGLEIELVSIQNFKTEKKFSVITMCDVLEHVEDPYAVLKKCSDLLMPGGLLYIQVPNVVGLKYPFGDTLGLPHHLWQFNPATMRRLTHKVGMETIGSWTGIQGVIRYYEQGGPSFIRQGLWRLARITRRGNRLQVLVRK
ncbi:MAG: class I SAM-dependent methyltransferase [Bacteriovoracia bacterium]